MKDWLRYLYEQSDSASRVEFCAELHRGMQDESQPWTRDGVKCLLEAALLQLWQRVCKDSEEWDEFLADFYNKKSISYLNSDEWKAVLKEAMNASDDEGNGALATRVGEIAATRKIQSDQVFKAVCKVAEDDEGVPPEDYSVLLGNLHHPSWNDIRTHNLSLVRYELTDAAPYFRCASHPDHGYQRPSKRASSLSDTWPVTTTKQSRRRQRSQRKPRRSNRLVRMPVLAI